MLTGQARGTGRTGIARTRRGFAGAAVVLVVGAASAGCAVGPLGGGPASATLAPSGGASGTATPPAGQEKLAAFYGQKLSWQDCDGNQCAWLSVPVDYAKPDGETLKLRVLKVPARGQSKGVLFVNPGGPGGSATDYAAVANFIVTPKVRQTYDVVGVDPRGVAKSNPVRCLDDPAMDTMLGADPTPDDAAERAEAEKIGKDFGAACQAKYPALLPHLGTTDVVRDMDIARGVLGQNKFTYLGKSYGTYLGAIYADTFPGMVGRMVLDGAMAPSLTDKELSLGQAQGFETATRSYVADCVKKGGCPLGGSVEEGMKAIRDLLTGLDAKPIPVKGDVRVTQLTEGWASLGLAAAMYAQERWPQLTTALRGAKAGDGTGLFDLANSYADREEGRYTNNLMQVITAVNCLDHPVERLSEEQQKAQVAEFSKVAPTWGPFMAGSSYTCLNWPAPPTLKPKAVAAEGAPPILVVGTTRDPATPYEWAEKMARELTSGRLVSWDGDGHTAYMRSNRCVNDAVDGYLVDGKVPDGDVKC